MEVVLADLTLGNGGGEAEAVYLHCVVSTGLRSDEAVEEEEASSSETACEEREEQEEEEEENGERWLVE